jgi:hypothetical protein
MEREQVVFVQCKFRGSGFPNERIFIVESESGVVLRGIAPLQYCYTREHRPLGDKPDAGKEVDGLVVGVVIASIGKIVRVYLPDGEVYDLDSDQVTPVPVGGVERVSIES